MPQKRYRPEEIIAKLREAEVLLGQGKKVPEVVKALGINEVSYYRWRKEYGGLNVSQAKRLKELERENRACAERSPISPSTSSSCRRPPGETSRAPRVDASASRQSVRGLHVSERRACRALASIAPANATEPQVREDEDALTAAIDRPGAQLRPLRLQAHHRPSADGRLAGERQARAAHLAR